MAECVFSMLEVLVPFPASKEKKQKLKKKVDAPSYIKNMYAKTE